MRANALTPTFWTYCPTCRVETHHSGLTDERGREIGTFCLDCDRQRPLAEQEQARDLERQAERLRCAS